MVGLRARQKRTPACYGPAQRIRLLGKSEKTGAQDRTMNRRLRAHRPDGERISGENTMYEDLPEVNEYNQTVPPAVVEAARKRNCLHEVKYVYLDGDYGGRFPVASINCRSRATRFQSENYQNFKVSLGDGWVAFRSPGGALPTEEVEEVDEVADVLNLLKYRPDKDDWLPLATELVERSINQLIQEFRNSPYLHRVEHSIHCQLFHIMMSHEQLAQRVLLGNDGAELNSSTRSGLRARLGRGTGAETSTLLSCLHNCSRDARLSLHSAKDVWRLQS